MKLCAFNCTVSPHFSLNIDLIKRRASLDPRLAEVQIFNRIYSTAHTQFRPREIPPTCGIKMYKLRTELVNNLFNWSSCKILSVTYETKWKDAEVTYLSLWEDTMLLSAKDLLKLRPHDCRTAKHPQCHKRQRHTLASGCSRVQEA